MHFVNGEAADKVNSLGTRWGCDVDNFYLFKVKDFGQNVLVLLVINWGGGLSGIEEEMEGCIIKPVWHVREKAPVVIKRNVLASPL